MYDELRLQPLTWKGFFFLLLTALFFLLGQTTLGAWFAPAGYAPDFGLIMVIYIGLNVPVVQGAALAVLIGFLKSTAGGGVFGFYSLVYLTVYLLTTQIRQRLDIAAPWHMVPIIFVFGAGAGIFSWAGYRLFGWNFFIVPTTFSSPAAIFLVSVVLTSVIGPPVFMLLEMLKPQPGENPENN